MQIDKSKIIRGQMKYVIRLMKSAKQEGYKKGFEDGKRNSLKHNINLMKLQLNANKEEEKWKIFLV